MVASHRLSQFCSFCKDGHFLGHCIQYKRSLCYGSQRSSGTWAEFCDHQLVAEWRCEACFTPSPEGAASSSTEWRTLLPSSSSLDITIGATSMAV